ncbi:MAG: hypothetical protein AAFZ18_27690, partial [Myxococcota bacterium]
MLADANVDGFNGAQDYASVVARAVDEAEDGHAFVTEFADSTVGLSGASLWSRMSLRRSALESATSRAEPRALTRAAQALFRDHPFVTRFRTALEVADSRAERRRDILDQREAPLSPTVLSA